MVIKKLINIFIEIFFKKMINKIIRENGFGNVKFPIFGGM